MHVGTPPPAVNPFPSLLYTGALGAVGWRFLSNVRGLGQASGAAFPLCPRHVYFELISSRRPPNFHPNEALKLSLSCSLLHCLKAESAAARPPPLAGAWYRLSLSVFPPPNSRTTARGQMGYPCRVASGAPTQNFQPFEPLPPPPLDLRRYLSPPFESRLPVHFRKDVLAFVLRFSLSQRAG